MLRLIRQMVALGLVAPRQVTKAPGKIAACSKQRKNNT